MQSGLYNKLLERKMIVPHQEVAQEPQQPESAYKILQPVSIEFISYPYEWSFSQLKDAALLTLELQGFALEHSMTLKDASAYNIQFHDGHPLLIDTLSFERKQEGQPWVAYKQFCQHFLAPLALMANVDVRLNQLLRVFIDGIPLDLVSRLLPARTWINFSLLAHIHLHARSQRHFAGRDVRKATTNLSMTDTRVLALLESLKSSVEKLNWSPVGTEWVDYYDASHNYQPQALEHKTEVVDSFLERVQPKTIWDLGANTGYFSRLGSRRGIPTYAFDVDPGAVELNYLQTKDDEETHLLPLLLDLTNPSSSIGWASEERMSLLERGPVDAIFALALIHHLAIGNNLPFSLISKYFADLGEWLLIEFVPKDDLQIQRMLVARQDIFPEYTQSNFETSFSVYYKIIHKEVIADSDRIIYFMKRR
jgi:ribosomal protein L11 methylase PrmA